MTRFLRQRKKLRRIDLGSCPWELVLGLLPELSYLRVLGVRIVNLGQTVLDSLVDAIPEQMLAIVQYFAEQTGFYFVVCVRIRKCMRLLTSIAGYHFCLGSSVATAQPQD